MSPVGVAVGVGVSPVGVAVGVAVLVGVGVLPVGETVGVGVRVGAVVWVTVGVGVGGIAPNGKLCRLMLQAIY